MNGNISLGEEIYDARSDLSQLENDDAENRIIALDRLLVQFVDHTVFWSNSGFETTSFNKALDKFQKQYNKWKRTKERDVSTLEELLGAGLRRLYDDFFIVRDRINRAQLLIREAEELSDIDKKVPLKKVIDTIKTLNNMEGVEERLKDLKETVFTNNKIDNGKLGGMALDYVRRLKEKAQEMEKKSIDVGNALAYLNKAKKHFSDDLLEKAINMCRLANVEMDYNNGLWAARVGKENGKEVVHKEGTPRMRKNKIVTIKKKAHGTKEMKMKKKCDELLRSAKKSISQLHYMGKDVGDILRIYMSARPAMLRRDYKTVRELAEKVHAIAGGMMAPRASEEELRTGRYAEPDVGFDFEIISDRYSPLVRYDGEDEDEDEGYVVEFECSECGAFVPESAEVCPNCGESFKETAEKSMLEDGIERMGETSSSDEADEVIPSVFHSDLAHDVTDLAVRERNEMEAYATGSPGVVLAPELGEGLSAAKLESVIKKAPPGDQIMKLIKTKHKKAEELAEAGKLKEAMALLDTILNIKPDYPPALNDKGSILFSLGEGEKALVQYDMSIEADSKIQDTWTNKGFVLHQMGNRTGAFYCYERALALSPDNVEVLSSLGALYFELEKYSKALKYFRRATEIKPDDSELWYFQAYTNENQGLWEEAVRCYDEVLKRDPLNHDATSGRDKCLMKLKFEKSQS